MPVAKHLSGLKNAGILTQVDTDGTEVEFRKLNLIYGFNGSGKSTLARIFECLETGKCHDKLSDKLQFRLITDEGSIPFPAGVDGPDSRFCVFNEDFITRHLQWGSGEASSIFYISEEQTGAVKKLEAKQVELDGKKLELTANEAISAERKKGFSTYKSERAKSVAGKLHQQTRYEAAQLKHDHDKLEYDDTSILSLDDLAKHEETARAPSPPKKLNRGPDLSDKLTTVVENARAIAEKSIGAATLEEIENHPTMVGWLKTGHEYHDAHDLSDCLLCGNELSSERKKTLAEALDDRLSQLMAEISITLTDTESLHHDLVSRSMWPTANEVAAKERGAFEEKLQGLNTASKGVGDILVRSTAAIEKRRAEPTLTIDGVVPSDLETKNAASALEKATRELNEVLDRHNEASQSFDADQSDARLAIRKHFAAEGADEYQKWEADISEADAATTRTRKLIDDIKSEISVLTMKVKTHGPAAEKISRLVAAYLGHSELTIFPAEKGYELHRHNKLVEGPPSEGEKTAIALCYFLSKLEEDGRSLKDMIVIIDDPVSSLDTKAMNYACALIRSRVEQAGQLFILTHNLHCMNEFKKAWRGHSEDKKDADGKVTKPAKASLLFLDVSMPEGSSARASALAEMPSQLRAYDSEYHFLCRKSLEFRDAKEGYSQYWFMMPNVIRRILEVFLGFREPGSHPLQQKIANAAKGLEIDPIRVTALERLVQVESHSDSLDDLIAHSSMTIEETRKANEALWLFMEKADGGHTKAIRKQCKPS